MIDYGVAGTVYDKGLNHMPVPGNRDRSDRSGLVILHTVRHHPGILVSSFYRRQEVSIRDTPTSRPEEFDAGAGGHFLANTVRRFADLASQLPARVSPGFCLLAGFRLGL